MILLGVIGLIIGLGSVILRTQSGADPATALTLIPAVPADLEERLTWLPDRPLSLQQRVMEPNTREQITGAYLRAWAQWGISQEIGQPYGLQTYFSGPALADVTHNVTTTVASGWQIRQSTLRHELELHYYADDGSIVAFTDINLHLVQQFRRSTASSTSADESYILESNHRYDIVMLLEDGNWRIYQWQRLGNGEPILESPWSAKTSVASHNMAPQTEIASIHNGQLWLDEQAYAIAGINYYPQAAPWTKFWPEYDPEQTTIDLERVQALGLNTVRIFLSFTDFGGADVLPLRRGQLNDFLARAEQANLKVIVTLFDHHTDRHPNRWAADARHLATLIPHFAEHPTILAWDIKNEPDRDYEFNTQPLVDAWLRFVARHVRWHDPNHLITIGWATPEAATALTDVVDFISFHYFDHPSAYLERVATLQNAAGDKPILLQEFTFSTWNSPFYPGQTEIEQANYYAAILNDHQTLNSLGYMVWTLYDFDEVPLAEFRTSWQRGAQANMGLIRRDGTMKRAAALVDPLAERLLVIEPFWRHYFKPFWLLSVSFLTLCLSFFWWAWRRRDHR